ncbi:hypothetical protein JCM5296_007204, partial [Sporobolomyces johnsonii]
VDSTERVGILPPPGAEPSARTSGVRDPAHSSISPRDRVVSPLALSEWEAMYHALPESQKVHYAPVIAAIQGGFDVGIADSESLPSTFTATPQSRYSAEEVTAILDYLHEELDAGRVVGPLPCEEVERILDGPFQTSIFKLVDKPGSEKKRFVRDFSSPRRGPLPSINERIAQNNSGAYRFKTVWHLFHHIADVVLALPPHARVYITDIMNAFRQLATLPSQRRWTVMNLDDNYYIDLALPMGLSTSTEAWGSVADLLRDGLEREWFDFGFRLRNWVDDFALIFERPLGGSWAEMNTRVDERLKRLGLPRRTEKDQPIDPDDMTFPLIGFVWCVKNKTVHLLEKKRAKFLARLKPLLNQSMRVQLEPLERMVGSLVHLAHVVPEGKFRLRALFAFTAEFNGNYFASKHPSSAKTKVRLDDRYEGVYGELLWWQELLSGASSSDGVVCSIGCALTPSLPDLDAELLSDASDSGVGILVNGHWALRRGWKGVDGRNIDFAEALGVELAVVALLSLAKGRTIRGFNVVAYCDNMSVVDGWAAKKHANAVVNRVLRRLLQLFSAQGATLQMIYIKSEENDADEVSRGLFPGEDRRLSLELSSWPEVLADLQGIAQGI